MGTTLFRRTSLTAWGRFAAAWAFTLSFTFVACLVALCLGPERMWVVCARFWAQTTLKILNIRVVVHHAERLEEPAIIIANHQSLIDVVLVPAIMPPRVKFVAKRELRLIPFWGWAFMLGGAIPVDRSRPNNAARALGRGLKKLGTKWSVVFFPEGTRTPGLEVGPLKAGAFRAALTTGRRVVPLGISSTAHVDPSRTALLLPGVVHIHVGKSLNFPRVRDSKLCTADLLHSCLQAGRVAMRTSIARAARHASRACSLSEVLLSARVSRAHKRRMGQRKGHLRPFMVSLLPRRVCGRR